MAWRLGFEDNRIPALDIATSEVTIGREWFRTHGLGDGDPSLPLLSRQHIQFAVRDGALCVARLSQNEIRLDGAPIRQHVLTPCGEGARICLLGVDLGCVVERAPATAGSRWGERPTRNGRPRAYWPA